MATFDELIAALGADVVVDAVPTGAGVYEDQGPNGFTLTKGGGAVQASFPVPLQGAGATGFSYQVHDDSGWIISEDADLAVADEFALLAFFDARRDGSAVAVNGTVAGAGPGSWTVGISGGKLYLYVNGTGNIAHSDDLPVGPVFAIVSKAGAATTIDINGDDQTAADTNHTLVDFGAGQFRIGEDWGGAAWSGLLGRIVLVKRALTAPERAAFAVASGVPTLSVTDSAEPFGGVYQGAHALDGFITPNAAGAHAGWAINAAGTDGGWIELAFSPAADLTGVRVLARGDGADANPVATVLLSDATSYPVAALDESAGQTVIDFGGTRAGITTLRITFDDVAPGGGNPGWNVVFPLYAAPSVGGGGGGDPTPDTAFRITSNPDATPIRETNNPDADAIYGTDDPEADEVRITNDPTADAYRIVNKPQA